MAKIPFQVGGGSGVQIVDSQGNPIQTSDAVTAKDVQTYTPTTSDIIIPSGIYLNGEQTIAGTSGFSAGNIKKGITIYSVTGSMNDMNDDAYWFNNGGVAGKPFEGGYCSFWQSSSRAYYYKHENPTTIGLSVGSSSGQHPVYSRYTFDTTPYKGFRLHFKPAEGSFGATSCTLGLSTYDSTSATWTGGTVSAPYPNGGWAEYTGGLPSGWYCLRLWMTGNATRDATVDIIQPILK